MKSGRIIYDQREEATNRARQRGKMYRPQMEVQDLAIGNKAPTHGESRHLASINQAAFYNLHGSDYQIFHVNSLSRSNYLLGVVV